MPSHTAPIHECPFIQFSSGVFLEKNHKMRGTGITMQSWVDTNSCPPCYCISGLHSFSPIMTNIHVQTSLLWELTTDLPILLLANDWVSYFTEKIIDRSQRTTLPFPSEFASEPSFSWENLAEERLSLQVDPILTWPPPNPSGILFGCSLLAFSTSSSTGSFLPAWHCSLESSVTKEKLLKQWECSESMLSNTHSQSYVADEHLNYAFKKAI